MDVVLFSLPRQQCLNFFPLPQGQGSLRPMVGVFMMMLQITGRWPGFLQLLSERDELLLFLFKFSQPRIDSGDITKLVSAAILIRHELEAV